MFRVKSLLSSVAAWVVLTGVCAQDIDVAGLLPELRGEGEAVARTPEQWQQTYAAVIAHLLPKMGAENIPDRQGDQQMFQTICWHASRPDADIERLAACQAICSALAGDMPQPARVWLLKQLEHIGRAEATDTLSTHMAHADAEVRERARRALANNTAPDAADKLRAALDKAGSPEEKAAVIDALAYRPDPADAPLFAKSANAGPDVVRFAAIKALGTTGGESEAGVVEKILTGGPDGLRGVATDSYLKIADALCTADRRSTALSMYKKLMETERHVKCAAIVGLGRAGGTAELPVIFAILEGDDVQLKGAALTALALLPPAEVLAAITARLKEATPTLKIALLRALADNGNPDILPTFVAAAETDDEQVRVAAYEAMGQLRHTVAAKPLVAAVAKETGLPLDAAKNALMITPGDDVVEAVGTELKRATPEGRLQLVSVLFRRQTPASRALLVDVAKSAPETDLRLSALEGLRKLATEEDLPALVDVLLGAKTDGERDAIQKAVVAITRRAPELDKCAEPLLARLAGADISTRAPLLRCLGKMGGSKALDAVSAALEDKSPEIQDAAVRSLADWPDLEAVNALWGVIRDDPNLVHKVLAVRGYIRIVDEADEPTTADKLAKYNQLMKLPLRADEKKLVLGGVGALLAPEALVAATGYLEDADLVEEAAAAVLKIADALKWSDPGASEAALAEVVAKSKVQATQEEATAMIEKIRSYADHIQRWAASGCYEEKGKNRSDLFDIAFPPERDELAELIELEETEAPVPVPETDEKPVDWKPVRTGENPENSWFVNLEETVARKSNCVAYLRTWVRSPDQRDARLEYGSDDGSKVWLNGTQVIAENADQALVPAQSKVDVKLRKGWNKLMAKVTQSGAQWSAAARFRAPDGARLSDVVYMDSADALELVIADLDANPDDTEAALAAVDIVDGGAGPVRLAARALRKASKLIKEKTVLDRIIKKAEEFDAAEDMITDWEYCGPYTQAVGGKSIFDSEFEPEKNAAKVKWQPVPLSAYGNPPGVVLFEKIYGGDNRAAYLRTKVHSPADMDVELQVGSDDGVKCWVNGELVHKNNASRPVRPHEDKAKAKLKKGLNTFMMKVSQGGGQWGGCARIRDADGNSIEGLKTGLKVGEK